MEMAPVVATLTSGLAIGLTIVLVRLMRVERQRSDARVAALVTLAAQPGSAAAFDAPLRLEPRRPVARPVARQATRPAARISAADVEIFRDRVPVEAAQPASPELFEPAVPRTGSHLLYIGAGALVMVTVIAMGFRWAVSSPVATTETTAPVAAGAPASAQPLSLLSLRHEQSPDGTLVISGVVSNPAGSIARERVFAAASLVDAEGALVATARAPLDFTTLAPGEESPFVVRIAAAAGVARYRVGFRDADGNAVAHLDKR